jgi:hypothetical protein
MTPTAAPTRSHQLASTTQDTRLPATEIRGSPPDALSTNMPALMIASSSASAHSAPGAIDPDDRKSSSPRLAMSTIPPPLSGASGRPTRRATIGTAVAATPKTA